MANCGRYFSKTCTPMLAAGRHSDDGSSFVISENGTEEADNEIRRICFGNNNMRIPTASEIGEVSPEEEEEDAEEQAADQVRQWTAGIAQFRASTESWTRWASLPTRRKKAAILQYYSFARLFRIVTVKANGDKVPAKCCVCPKDNRITEMQITDCDGCPLFDAWLQRSAWPHTGSRWIVEACGNLIFTIQRSESIVTIEKTCPQLSFSSKRLFPRSTPNGETNKIACRRWSITDWNGDHFGYLVASGGGEAVFLETADKETVGKFVRQCTLSRRLRTESTDLTDNFSNIRTPTVSVTPRRRIRRSVPCVQKITWTCVHHENGQRLMRLEDDEVACFEAVHGINLATKLLILAGIVKIVGDLHRAFSDSCSFLSSRGRSAFCK